MRMRFCLLVVILCVTRVAFQSFLIFVYFFSFSIHLHQFHRIQILNWNRQNYVFRNRSKFSSSNWRVCFLSGCCMHLNRIRLDEYGIEMTSLFIARNIFQRKFIIEKRPCIPWHVGERFFFCSFCHIFVSVSFLIFPRLAVCAIHHRTFNFVFSFARLKSFWPILFEEIVTCILRIVQSITLQLFLLLFRSISSFSFIFRVFFGLLLRFNDGSK